MRGSVTETCFFCVAVRNILIMMAVLSVLGALALLVTSVMLIKALMKVSKTVLWINAPGYCLSKGRVLIVFFLYLVGI